MTDQTPFETGGGPGRDASARGRSAEQRLRDDLGSLAADAPTRSLDTATITRLARSRRRPRLVAVTAVCSLALLGVGTVGVQALQQWGQGPVVTDSAAPLSDYDDRGEAGMTNGATESQPVPEHDGSTEGTPGDSAVPAPLQCGEPAPVASTALPIAIEVDGHSAPPGATTVPVTVTITNTSDSPIMGWTGPRPTLVISDGSRVLWHSHGAVIAIAIEVALAPGESQSFTSEFDAVSCASEEALEAGRTPPLEPGEYGLTASIDVTLEEGGALQLVSAPAVLTIG